MKFIYTDGGRSAAGFKSKKNCGDCVCRAIAIATQRPYDDIYALIEHYAANERTGKRKRKRSDPEHGVYPQTTRRIMDALGWEWVPTMGIGTGCRVHLRADELPAGRLVVNVSRHMTAIIDGVVYDTYDPTRNGNRCVYGYYRPTAHALKPTDPIIPAAKHARDALERADAPRKANTHTRKRTRRTQARTQYDAEGWRIFTPAQMRRAVESLIPAAYRPYYTGVEIEKAWCGKLTADNSELYVYFKSPVCGTIDNTRYIHARLCDLPQEIDALYISHTPDADADIYAEYDAGYGGRPVVPIKGEPIELDRQRRALVATWKRHN